MPQQADKLLYGGQSAADAIELSTRAIDYLIATGELDAVRLGKRVLVTAESLRRFAGRSHARIRPVPERTPQAAS